MNRKSKHYRKIHNGKWNHPSPPPLVTTKMINSTVFRIPSRCRCVYLQGYMYNTHTHTLYLPKWNDKTFLYLTFYLILEKLVSGHRDLTCPNYWMDNNICDQFNIKEIFDCFCIFILFCLIITSNAIKKIFLNKHLCKLLKKSPAQLCIECIISNHFPTI